MVKFTRNLKHVEAGFDREALAQVCILDETDFGDAYGMLKIAVDGPGVREPDDYYYFKDNGSTVLAVAHLDTVSPSNERAARFVDTEAGPVVYSRALDDRLGAYIILHLLPELGIQYDILLTVGEESGMSTAEYFMSPDKEYDWIIEFDRGGTDVVMYQYEDDETIDAVRATGAVVGNGIFSDISYMEHLGVKAFNWGVGYRDYHGPRSHAYLDDTMEMVARYLKFHQQNYDKVYYPHTPKPVATSSTTGYWWDDDDLSNTSPYHSRYYSDDPAWWNESPTKRDEGIYNVEVIAMEDDIPELSDIDYVSDNPTPAELQRLEDLIDAERARGEWDEVS